MGAGRGGRSRKIGSIILRLDSISSTNSLASQLAESGCPDGMVIRAGIQTAGRGRRGHSWHSNSSGLWFSVVLRPRLSPRQAQVLTFLGAVAAARALKSAGVPVELKWPNDLMWNGRKMGGILTEAVVSGGMMKYAVTGIGLNVSGGPKDFPANLRRTAVTASQAAGKNIELEPLFRRILAGMDALYAELRRPGGAQALVTEWGTLAAGMGQRVVLREGNRRWAGIVAGFGPDGSLIMLTSKGEKKVFHSGDVTVAKKRR